MKFEEYTETELNYMLHLNWCTRFGAFVSLLDGKPLYFTVYSNILFDLLKHYDRVRTTLRENRAAIVKSWGYHSF
jgi:hypothetical protein